MARLSTTFGILRYELRQHLVSPLFWIGGTVLFLLGFLVVAIDGLAADLGAVGGVHRNAPYVVMLNHLYVSQIGIFFATAFVAGAVLRDYDHGMHETFFALPITKREYLPGRFGGAFLATALVFVFVAVAFLVGGALPWIDPDRLGPFRISTYLFSILVIALPNLLLFSAIVFAVATATRSMMYSFAAVIGIVVAHAVSRSLLGDVATEAVAALLDPFGLSTFRNATRYWTTAERNTLLLPLDGPFLWNRVLWLGVSVGLLATAYARFTFGLRDRRGRRSPKAGDAAPQPSQAAGAASLPAVAAAEPATWTLPPVRPSHTMATHVRQLFGVARREIRTVVRSAPFLVILAFGLVTFMGNARALEQFAGGMRPVPVTGLMLEVINYFVLYAWIILAVYASELSWRERAARMDELTDALPAPVWVRWGGKLAALATIAFLVLLLAAGVGIGTQLSAGYTTIEPGLYARGFLLWVGIPMVHFAVLALFVQVLVNHRFAGYLVLLGVALGYSLLSRIGVDHPLLWPPAAVLPDVAYSDMNGFGPFIRRLVWFYLYWTLAAALLLVMVHLLWPRGKETGLRGRLAAVRRRWSPGVRAYTGIAGLGLVGVGSWIFYNTNVLNEYLSPHRLADIQVRYETEYGRYAALPQPKITAVRAEVDIYPYRGALEVRGTFRLRNETEAPIPAVHVTMLPWIDRTELRIAGATTTHHDAELGYSIHTLARPLEPGEEIELAFDVAIEKRGFTARSAALSRFDGGFDTHIVRNGSFIRSGYYLPTIGYLRGLEVADPGERRRRGLPAKAVLPPADDAAARHVMFDHANWIDFESVVSTSADQVAIAPGTLVREWEADGRRFFHYRAEHPMEPMWVYLSGKWTVARERWNDVDIAVYHHAGHAFNVRRMLDAAKASLEFFGETFGPYPERALRIVEFPRYAQIGESHATQVLISESAGFIANAEQPGAAFDFVSHIVAHEVAHEWWGNSLIPANTRGRMMVIESLAEYSAILGMRHRLGEDAARRYLRYALDQYLRGRGAATAPERPLVDVTDDHGYVAYPKGGMALYALADHFGEQAVNGALRRFYADHAYGGPPFPTSRDLLGYLEEIVPADRRGVLEDWFETITIWKLRTAGVRAFPRGDGTYAVQIDIEAAKLRVNGEGEEREIAIDDWIDIAVFAGPGAGAAADAAPLYLRKHRITAAATTLEVIVDRRPGSAGIDPFHRLIDRNPDDNVTAVDVFEREGGRVTDSDAAEFRQAAETFQQLYIGGSDNCAGIMSMIAEDVQLVEHAETWDHAEIEELCPHLPG